MLHTLVINAQDQEFVDQHLRQLAFCGVFLGVFGVAMAVARPAAFTMETLEHVLTVGLALEELQVFHSVFWRCFVFNEKFGPYAKHFS